MAEKKHIVPETLAILPVRDTVLFPGAVLPLTVGRESSLALVNSLSGEEKMLGVVAQLDPRIEVECGLLRDQRLFDGLLSVDLEQALIEQIQIREGRLREQTRVGGAREWIGLAELR